jgi:probable rRNA maturation factor
LPIAALDRFWRRICEELGLARDGATICFVSAPQMARWNRTYRGKSGPTDVLSFPAKPTRTVAVAARPGAPRSGSEYLGDIAIAPAVARRNARRFGRTLGQELRILMLHGALHLLGYDHERDHGEMERIEGRLRRRLGLES